MKPLLDVLVILDALDKEGSFAAASAKLYKTPSALSYTIHKLESDLNIQLLDRSGHRARFTRTGQMLLEKGRDVLHTARELEKQAVRLHQGWENALILNVDATFPFSLLAPSIAAPSRDYHRRRVAAGRRSGEPDGIRSSRPADAAVCRTGLGLFTAIPDAAFNRPRRATDNKNYGPRTGQSRMDRLE